MLLLPLRCCWLTTTRWPEEIERPGVENATEKGGRKFCQSDGGSREGQVKRCATSVVKRSELDQLSLAKRCRSARYLSILSNSHQKKEPSLEKTNLKLTGLSWEKKNQILWASFWKRVTRYADKRKEEVTWRGHMTRSLGLCLHVFFFLIYLSDFITGISYFFWVDLERKQAHSFDSSSFLWRINLLSLASFSPR